MQTMKISNFPNGLTVKEFKEIVKDWVESDEDGEPTEVWIETGLGLSSVVIEISPLNKRGDVADMLLSSE